eukprot:4875841-Prymnesium_polylepis.2
MRGISKDAARSFLPIAFGAGGRRPAKRCPFGKCSSGGGGSAPGGATAMSGVESDLPSVRKPVRGAIKGAVCDKRA